MSDILKKAVLVKLSISVFNPKRQDQKVTNEVLIQRKAKREAGNWIKNLINPDHITKVMNVAQRARLKNYDLSMAWESEGWRILPITLYQDYQDKIREFKKEFQQEVDYFLKNYPSYIDEAKIALNGMFNLKEYPSIEIVKDKFDFTIDVLPVPSGDDFRLTLGDGDMSEIRENVNKQVEQAVMQANRDLWQRVATPIKRMIDRLSKADAIFRDSLISNIKDIVSLIPDLNITDDIELVKISQEIKDSLTVYDTDILRENKDVRQEALQKAENLLKKMEGYI